MTVRVILFARLREICNAEAFDLDVDESATPADCFDRLVARFSALESSRGRLMVAVNERYAAWDSALAAGDEVAFIPPVSGG